MRIIDLFDKILYSKQSSIFTFSANIIISFSTPSNGFNSSKDFLPGHPKKDDTFLRCTVISGQKLKSAKCENYPTKPDVKGKRLGYICEARPMDTLDGTRSCHFPFKHQGNTHYACAAPDSAEGAPWCATKVLFK